MVQTGFEKDVNKEMDKRVQLARNKEKVYYPDVFNVKYIKDNQRDSETYNFSSFGGIGLLSEVDAGSELATDSILEAYSGNVVMKTFGKSIPLQKETKRDVIKDLQSKVDKISDWLGRAAQRTIDYYAFEVLLNQGTTTKTALASGASSQKAIFATNHDVVDNKFHPSTTTFPNYFDNSNLPAYNSSITDMSMDVDPLAAMEHNLMKGQLNPDGKEANVPARLCIYPPALSQQAKTIFGSPSNPSNANDQLNTFKDCGIKHFSVPWLDEDATNAQSSPYYLMGEKTDHGLYVVVRQKPETNIWYSDKYRTYYYDITLRFWLVSEHPLGVVRAQGC